MRPTVRSRSRASWLRSRILLLPPLPAVGAVRRDAETGLALLLVVLAAVLRLSLCLLPSDLSSSWWCWGNQEVGFCHSGCFVLVSQMVISNRKRKRNHHSSDKRIVKCMLVLGARTELESDGRCCSSIRNYASIIIYNQISTYFLHTRSAIYFHCVRLVASAPAQQYFSLTLLQLQPVQ